MRVKDFDYNLPEELIAQKPLKDRSSSKLMILDKDSGNIKDCHFSDIISFFKAGDVLVLNDTKVMPSRIYGNKVDTNALIELLLLKEIDEDVFESLVKPARRVKVGTKIAFNNVMQGKIVRKLDDGICHVKFSYQGIFIERLEELGEMPLPPYIHEKLEDKERYQTVYANKLGSAAAPTAGFHFTTELLESIKAIGVKIHFVTLHVGLGTFRPVSVEAIEDHKMHSELFTIDKETANALNEAKDQGQRIISVGTTTTRTLESVYTKYNKFMPLTEETDIFIYPGYEFKAIDGLITNFHLPKSTLLMLVSAFTSRDIILNAYEYAIKNNYRFFSFGDAMFIK